MIVYQNGSTTHLFPYCRGAYGQVAKVDTTIGLRQCHICIQHARMIERAKTAERLHNEGLSFQDIGDQWGISRQAVVSLVQRMREEPYANQ